MLNYKKLKGYEKLSQRQKELFKRVYENHMACIESETLKEKYTPVKVAPEEYGVKVEFKAATWLHYNWKGEWY